MYCVCIRNSFKKMFKKVLDSKRSEECIDFIMMCVLFIICVCIHKK